MTEPRVNPPDRTVPAGIVIGHLLEPRWEYCEARLSVTADERSAPEEVFVWSNRLRLDRLEYRVIRLAGRLQEVCDGTATVVFNNRMDADHGRAQVALPFPISWILEPRRAPIWGRPHDDYYLDLGSPITFVDDLATVGLRERESGIDNGHVTLTSDGVVTELRLDDLRLRVLDFHNTEPMRKQHELFALKKYRRPFLLRGSYSPVENQNGNWGVVGTPPASA